MTPRQAMTWAEVSVTLICWALYAWGTSDAVPPAWTTLAELLWPSFPNLIMLGGALALTRGFVFVAARSPRLSAPGFENHDEYSLLGDSRNSDPIFSETIAVLMGRRKHIKPFATDEEAAVWRSAGRSGWMAFLVTAGLLALAAGVWVVALRRPLFSDTADQVLLIVNGVWLCWLVGFLTHRGLFLRLSPKASGSGEGAP